MLDSIADQRCAWMSIFTDEITVIKATGLVKNM